MGKFLSREEWLKRLRVRFWAKVDKSPGLGPGGECWQWVASLHRRDGCRYGEFEARRPEYGFNTRRAHIVSWLLHFGPTNGLHVCHRCDNPACVRPDHLWLGTHQQNMADAKKKGRMGADPRINPETIAAIKTAAGRYAEIASRFSVHKHTVCLIKTGNYPYSKQKRHWKPGRPPKFTRSEIEQITAATGTQKEIAARFNTSQMSVCRIKRGLVTLVRHEAAA